MNSKGNALKESLQSAFALIVIFGSFLAALAIYKFVMGSPANFEGGNVEGHPLPGNYLAIIYKGGPIVPVLITTILVLLSFSFERFITLWRANGKGRISTFVREIQALLASNKVEEAAALCDVQKGSIGNVVKASLYRYRDLQNDATLPNDQKVLALQKDMEEAVALELPMLSKNLVILSTIASIAVLIGLIGTVLGMIRAFAALATAGSPDALALATGISEALINTAFGITGSTFAIILYNYFSTKIDNLTFNIDEINFSVAQTFATTLKK